VYLQRNECGCIEQEKQIQYALKSTRLPIFFWAGPSQVHCTS